MQVGERIAAAGPHEQRVDCGHDEDGLETLAQQDHEGGDEDGARGQARRVSNPRPVEEALDRRRLASHLGQRRARAQEPAIAHHLRLDLPAQAAVHRVEAGLGELEAVR